jgi:hypothetical protein
METEFPAISFLIKEVVGIYDLPRKCHGNYERFLQQHGMLKDNIKNTPMLQIIQIY